MSVQQLKDFVDGNFEFVVNHYINDTVIMSNSALIFKNDIQQIQHCYYNKNNIKNAAETQLFLCAAYIGKLFDRVSDRKFVNLTPEEYQEIKDILYSKMFERLYEF